MTIIFGLVMMFLMACEEDSPKQGIEDKTAPSAAINGSVVTADATITVKADEALIINFSDETGLASYELTIGDVIDMSDDIEGVAVQVTVDISELTLDTEYAATVTVVDASDNTTTVNFKLVVSNTVVAAYDELYIIGSATPAGWNIGSQVAMTKNGAVFTWTGVLNAGEIKIPTFSVDDWCGGDWILAESAGQLIEDAAGYTVFVNGCAPDEADFKWTVSNAGNYTITIDLEAATIKFEAGELIEGYAELFIIGDAVPGIEWDVASAPAFTQDVTNPLIYTFEGVLQAGNFKIGTIRSFDAGSDWLHPLTDGQALTETGYQVIVSADGAADPQWTITADEAGTYKVIVDLVNMTVSISLVPQYYAGLYLIGDATANGWDVASGTAMTVDPNNAAVFTYSGVLTAGNFKIATDLTGGFDNGYDWIYAAIDGQSLTASTYTIGVSGTADDNKWSVATEDTYTITIDLANETINIGAPYANLYFVGDALAGGWDPFGASTKFTRDATNVNVFTYSGSLVAGSLKIHLTSGDWCVGDWLNASTADEAISGAQYLLTNGCDGPDNKWVVSAEDAGDYLITVDLENESIVFLAQ